MAAFLVRWTNDDFDENLPARFAAALKLAGGKPGPKTRALIRAWTEEVERNDGDPATRQAARMVAKKQAASKKQGQ